MGHAKPSREAPQQRHGAVLTHLARPPQAGADHHGPSHPDHAALLLDAALVGLHLPQVTRWRDQMLLHRLTLDASAGQPTRHRPRGIARRHDDRLVWTPVGHQRHHQADRLRRGPQAIPCRALRGAERLVTLCTQEALVRAPGVCGFGCGGEVCVVRDGVSGGPLMRRLQRRARSLDAANRFRCVDEVQSRHRHQGR